MRQEPSPEPERAADPMGDGGFTCFGERCFYDSDVCHRETGYLCASGSYRAWCYDRSAEDSSTESCFIALNDCSKESGGLPCQLRRDPTKPREFVQTDAEPSVPPEWIGGEGPAPARTCCMVCKSGQPCGNGCIAAGKTCRSPPGCAC